MSNEIAAGANVVEALKSKGWRPAVLREIRDELREHLSGDEVTDPIGYLETLELRLTALVGDGGDPVMSASDEAYAAAALDLAGRVRPDRHGQLCPVWTAMASVERCNCWILSQAQADAAVVLAVAAPLLVAAGRREAAEAIRDESINWCMDGVGRHLIGNCVQVAEGTTADSGQTADTGTFAAQHLHSDASHVDEHAFVGELGGPAGFATPPDPTPDPSKRTESQ
jgi:hypothetical protein